MSSFEEANSSKDQAVEWVQTSQGAKAFADTVVTSAFVKYGNAMSNGMLEDEESNEELESCGKMLAMIHPSAVFHACCEHAHGGTSSCMRAMGEAGLDIDEHDGGVSALKALSVACDLLCHVVEKTRYYNYKNVCKALRSLPEALDKQRIHDEAFGSSSDGVWLGFNHEDGTLLLKEEDPEGGE
jgi:hypothetical protein